MSAFTEIVCADEAAWLKERETGIGASEAGVILGVSNWATPYELWGIKSGYVEPGESDSEAMEWGRRLEEPIAEKYATVTGYKLKNRGRFAVLRSVAHPFMFCTLDREIESDKGPGVLEIKTAGAHAADDWADGKVPLLYQVQVQHQLAVTGYAWAEIAVLIGGQKFGWAPIERNERFIDMLINKCGEFCQRIEKNDPPPVDGGKHTADAIRKMFPAPEAGKIVTLSDEAADWDAELGNVRDQIDALEAKERELKNKLMVAIGDAEAGTLPTGAWWSFRTIERKAHEVKASSTRQLRRHNPKGAAK